MSLRNQNEAYEYQYLKIGSIYTVYGIFHDLNSNLNYLIAPEPDNVPFYVPSGLFKIRDGKIPNSFEAGTLIFPDGSSRIIIAYNNLFAYRHHKGLIEQDSKELKVFWREKEEIDKELSRLGQDL